jgi:uncharacterized OB-fold protein
MADSSGHAPPPVNRDLAFLYEGFNRRQLLIQTCDDCGALRHPPSPTCLRCQSPAWTERVTAGRGKLHSYTVHHHPPIPPWPLPHVVALADMEEGFRFVAALPGVDGETLVIGQPLRIVFAEVEDGYWLPQFVLETA